MTDFDKNYVVFGVAGLLVAGLVGLAFMENAAVSEVDWQNVTLEEVDSGEEFTIQDLDKPVVVEPFAVWCPTCTRQQQEKQSLKQEREDFTSVNINIDANEDVSQVSRHKEEHDFDWRYAVAPTDMTNSLREDFGSSVLNAPRSPMILVCEDGSVEYSTGMKPADQISNEIDTHC